MHVPLYLLSFTSPYLVAYLSVLVLITSAWSVRYLAAERGESRLIALLLVPIIGQFILVRELILMFRRPPRRPDVASTE